ncbi:MAG: metallophosphoesterase family protein [Gammaproteobacteria bacterium]|nr:metallophosphoesterase family protein [Gammaproteobacteria bacterium]
METEPERGGRGRGAGDAGRALPAPAPPGRAGRRRAATTLLWLASGMAAVGCSDPPPAHPPPSGAIAFGVYGDGPYYPWEEPRAGRLLADAESAGVDFLVHIGDILGGSCADEKLRDRRRQLDGVPVPVVYTPGDNEWADCHAPSAGGYDPLERLAMLRRIFFDDPSSSLGAVPMPVTSQAKDAGFAEFPENARWTRGGFVFATLHVVGSFDATAQFPGRDHRHDQEVARRSEAALAWMHAVFDEARAAGASGIVLAAHANVRLESGGGDGYGPLVRALRDHAAAFPGEVLFIHGDTHTYRMDQPLTDERGRRLGNFTRLETFGSPDMGWVRVVVDTVKGEVVEIEPRLMKRWF